MTTVNEMKHASVRPYLTDFFVAGVVGSSLLVAETREFTSREANDGRPYLRGAFWRIFSLLGRWKFATR